MTTETRERITDPERLSRLEGAHLHMATKADIAALETRLTEKAIESEIRTNDKIAETNERIAETNQRIVESNERIAETNQRIVETNERIAATNERIAATNDRIVETNEKIAEINERIAETNQRIVESENRLIKWGVGVAATAFVAAASLAAAGFMLMYRLLSS